jgi:hypothetical protein
MNKTKPIDIEAIIRVIPEEKDFPKQRSELRRLYKRLARILFKEFHTEVPLVIDTSHDQGNFKEAERKLLTDACKSLIEVLKDCIEFCKLHASLPPDER